ELLIEKGAKVNLANKDGWAALMLAALNGYEEICKMLIEKGAEVGVAKEDGYTALMLAAEKGYKEVCQMLIENRAEVNLVEKNGATPIMIAAQNGYKEVCELLIEKGADVNLVEKDGWTALMVAAQNDYKEVCELLIGKGAKVNAKKQNGWTALMSAAREGHKEVCKLLIENGAEVGTAKEDGETALMLSAENGQKEVCELLIEKGAEVGAANKDGWTALMKAASVGHKELCKMLIEKGADVNATRKNGWTALMKAALVGHKEVCKVLIGKGAEVDAAKEDVETALMLSASVGHKELCKMLIEKGADVNATRKNGWTALMKAALFGYKEVCKVLMEKGAKVGAENKDGWTALMFAAFSGHKKVCEFFLDNVNPVDREKRTLLMYAALYGKREICELLIDRGLDVNSVNIDKWTPLMLVSLNSHFEFLPDEYSPRLHFSPLYMYLKLLVHRDFVQVCKLLLDRGAKIDFTNIGGDTALSIAASVGFNKVCNLLLERGANLNIKNKKGLSPLLLSAQNRHFAVFTTLLEFGAKFNKKTKKIMKDNPDFYNPDIIHCLLSTGNFDKVSMDYFRVAQFLSIDFLIAKFCEIGEMNKERYIAIHFAAMNESSTPLKQLITNDTFQGFVNCSSNRNKLSPLRLALKYKLFNNAKILLSKGASPFYNTSNTYFRKNRNVLEEKKKLKKYVSSEMLFDLLKDKDLENAQKRIYGPNDPEHNESYKDIIKLEVTDNRNRNVFHYLAECVEDVSTSEFLNRAVELDSFSKGLLIQEDNSGARPIHIAILNSNPYFIQHVSCLGILSKHELNLECNSETIFDIVKNKRVSKETIEAIIEYLWKYYEEEGVHSILYSDKDDQEKLASLASYLNEGNNIDDGKEGDRVIDHIVRADFLAGLEYVKDSVVDIDNLFLLGVNFSSVHCLDF
ncbi:MAG TPA: hypothetical protein DEP20_02615, partial [Fusobacteria bacterium]|nr:hypothetical protein [Fusobacteriota bacterium]